MLASSLVEIRPTADIRYVGTEAIGFDSFSQTDR